MKFLKIIFRPKCFFTFHQFEWFNHTPDKVICKRCNKHRDRVEKKKEQKEFDPHKYFGLFVLLLTLAAIIFSIVIQLI